MKIADRPISLESPPYIIAELGVNHDGSVDRALELTRAAAAAGADAVKLQLFETDRLMSKAAKLAAYQKAAGESDPISMLRRLELSIDDMARIVDLAHKLGKHAIVTVFSVELVAKAERLAWDAYKTASPDIVHKPLLEALAATGKPLIVSTGASTMEEVQQAVAWLTAAPEPRPSGSGAQASAVPGRPSGSGSPLPMRNRLALMQCVSCYPTPREHAELGGIPAIAAATKLPTGYSDHTDDFKTGFVAVRHGACLLEKHLTYDQRATGPDHAASLDPELFSRYVSMARHDPRDAHRWDELANSAQDSGRPTKRILDIERDVRTVSRQSMVTTRALPAGHTLRRDDLTFKRPGTGLLPFRIDEVLGKPLVRDVEADLPLTEEDVQW